MSEANGTLLLIPLNKQAGSSTCGFDTDSLRNVAFSDSDTRDRSICSFRCVARYRLSSCSRFKRKNTLVDIYSFILDKN